MDDIPLSISATEHRLLQTTLRSAMETRNVKMFTCPVCHRILRHPVTVKCGHTVCLECLVRKKCGSCALDVDEPQLSVNVLVQGLIEKWKERNKLSDLGECTTGLLHYNIISSPVLIQF